jgi:hypothetical protein
VVSLLSKALIIWKLIAVGVTGSLAGLILHRIDLLAFGVICGGLALSIICPILVTLGVKTLRELLFEVL